jgi:putative copper resistance protein D
MDAFLILSSWEILNLLCKLSVYFGLASIAGGSLFLVLYSDGSRKTTNTMLIYCGIGAFLGFQGAGLSFLSQVGQVNGNGLTGMFDLSLSRMLLDTQLGDVTLYRLLGFGLAFLVSIFVFFRIQRLKTPPKPIFYRRLFTLYCFALMGLVLSFRLIGHVSVLSTIAQLAIAIHVLAFGYWIGILFPLYMLAGVPDTNFVQLKLKRFGRHAILLLLLLGATGGLLIWQLLDSWTELFDTAYGQSIVVKLLLVLFIMAIAAFNKWRLVPKLNSKHGVRKFRRSVTIEGAVAFAILLVTAYLSTVIGPMQMDH